MLPLVGFPLFSDPHLLQLMLTLDNVTRIDEALVDRPAASSLASASNLGLGASRPVSLYPKSAVPVRFNSAFV